MEKHEVALLAGFSIFLVLNVADLLSTIVALGHAGLIETNPLAVYLMARLGEIPGLITLKVFVVLIIGFSVYAVIKTREEFFDDDTLITGLAFLNIIGFFICSNNFALIGWVYPVSP